MTRQEQVDSKEIGLAAGLIFGKYFLGTEQMHYGFWPGDLPLDISNVARAQDLYTEFLFSFIPEGTVSVLDVGCGTGANAKKLVDSGFSVECVSPSPFLTGYARNILGEDVPIHESTFEKLQIDRQFDMLLFSESFQYVGLDDVLNSAAGFLEGEGHILICDFFRRGGTQKSFMGGGHNIDEFHKRVQASPFEIVADEDITDRTAPNMDLVDDLLVNFAKPVWELFNYALDSNRPRISRFLKWKYRRRIEKMNTKYFSGLRNADNFKADKVYRLFLLKMKRDGKLEIGD